MVGGGRPGVRALRLFPSAPHRRAAHSPRVRRGAVWVASILASTFASTLAAAVASAETRAGAPDWTCHEDLCQRALRSGERLSIELQSRRPRSAWIAVEPFDLENVKILGRAPFLLELRAGETKVAGALEIEDPTRPYAYQARWQALPGDPNAVHDDRWLYRMPFGGADPVRISQGYDGGPTHQGLGAHALDFPLPLDTPVLAARGGTIVEVASDRVGSGRSSGSGGDAIDHRVVIEHADGSFGLYAHLRPDGPVRLGDRVETGDLIGRSGDAGNATGPHLHFEVYTIRRDGERRTIAVRFWDGSAKGFIPLAGVAYSPGCPRSAARGCRPGELPSEAALPAAPAAPAEATAPAFPSSRR